MKRLFLLAAAVFGLAMPVQSQQTIEQRVEVLEQMLGIKFLGMSSSELAASLTPANTLPCRHDGRRFREQPNRGRAAEDEVGDVITRIEHAHHGDGCGGHTWNVAAADAPVSRR